MPNTSRRTLLLTGAATLREGRVPVRVEAQRDRLLAVKRGEVPWTEVNSWRKELHGGHAATLEAIGEGAPRVVSLGE